MNSFFELTPDHILDSVEAALKLEGLSRPTGRVLALNSIENRVYDIECEDKSALIAKFYRPGRWTDAQILEEHSFLTQLETNEVPVVGPVRMLVSPKPVKSFAKNPTLATSDKDIRFAVFPKFQGRCFDEFNEDQQRMLGRFLARIHKVGQDRQGPSTRKKLTVETYGWESLDTIEDAGFLESNLGSRYLQVADNLCQRIEPRFLGFESQLVHGDCHFGNILWQQGMPHFVDFDDMVIAPPVQDLWMLMGGRDELAQKNLKTMLESYEDFCDFDRSSLALIEPLRALRIIHYSAWIARRSEDPSFPRMFPHFGTELWWQNEIEALQGILEFVEDPIVLA